MKTKTYLTIRVAIVALFLCTSCNKEPIGTSGETVQQTVNPYKVSVEDALSSLEDFIGSGSSLTKVGGISGISPKRISYLKSRPVLRTRANLSEITIPDTLLYLVDFDCDGYAILSADSRIPTVLAVAEEGSISLSDFIFSDTLEVYRDMDDTLEVNLYNAEEDDYYVGAVSDDNLANQLILQFAERQILTETEEFVSSGGNSSGSGTSSQTKLRWFTTDSIPALLTTLWHQRSPFNDLTPVRRKWGIGKKDNAPAGCVPVAVAQIMAYHEFPAKLTVNGYVVDWSGLKTICTVAKRDAYGNSADRVVAANLLSYIGICCNAIYRYKWTFATPTSAKKFLKMMGYSNVTLHHDKKKNFDTSEYIDMLEDGNPVFVGALSGMTNGHAWVIDGYKKQEYKRQADGTASNSRTLLHCNWGWQGSCNGYYEAGIFNPKKKGAVIKDSESVTDGNDTNSIAGKNYWTFRYITYDNPNKSEDEDQTENDGATGNESANETEE